MAETINLDYWAIWKFKYDKRLTGYIAVQKGRRCIVTKPIISINYKLGSVYTEDMMHFSLGYPIKQQDIMETMDTLTEFCRKQNLVGAEPFNVTEEFLSDQQADQESVVRHEKMVDDGNPGIIFTERKKPGPKPKPPSPKAPPKKRGPKPKVPINEEVTK